MLETWKKIRLPLLTILIVLLIDQIIKIYVKTHFNLQESYTLINSSDGRPKGEILFIENPGMAFGVQLWGKYGKLILSLFRIIASVFGVYYIRHIIRKKEHWGYIFCVALIFAGAVGNIIDSAFYGLIFDRSTTDHIATLFPASGGYETFLYGEVVDMFHFPVWRGTFPDWFPGWGGEDFEFFSPIFNFADASISMGVVLIFIFQKRFFKKHREEKATAEHKSEEQITAETKTSENSDTQNTAEKTEDSSEEKKEENNPPLDLPPLP